MKPIYKPSGAAAEYGDYAINIYTGCPHRCYYCFAPSVLRRDRERFHAEVKPRENIVEETRKQLERERITGQMVHLCFTCDPYPLGYDNSATREIIKLLKEYGNHVQILTKGNGKRDFDLLDENDWYGITFSGASSLQEPETLAPVYRINNLKEAHTKGIKTWISFEPVVNDDEVLKVLDDTFLFVDKVKVGKLNYHPSSIDWKDFGIKVEERCKQHGLDYYIKDSLRKEMLK